jgi:hypothetical protein
MHVMEQKCMVSFVIQLLHSQKRASSIYLMDGGVGTRVSQHSGEGKVPVSAGY